MRYLIRAKLKPGKEKAILRAINNGTLGAGSVAGGEYIRVMNNARLLANGDVKWVEVCYCETPLNEELPYWEEFFEILSISDAHNRENCQDANGEKPRACGTCDCTAKLEERFAGQGKGFVEHLESVLRAEGDVVMSVGPRLPLVPHSTWDQTSEGRVLQPLQDTEGGGRMDNSSEQIQVFADPDKSRRGFIRMFLITVSIIIIILLVVSIAVPFFLRNRRDAAGSACNGNLDEILSAKEEIAYRKNVRPGGPMIPLDVDEINSYLRGWEIQDGCPGGEGKYIVGDINDENGLVIIPVCTHSYAISEGTKTFGQDGLCIHRRSYEQDPRGVYRRIEGLTFADEVRASSE